jgi:hypothetical protein
MRPIADTPRPVTPTAVEPAFGPALVAEASALAVMTDPESVTKAAEIARIHGPASRHRHLVGRRHYPFVETALFGIDTRVANRLQRRTEIAWILGAVSPL